MCLELDRGHVGSGKGMKKAVDSKKTRHSEQDRVEEEDAYKGR